MRKYWGNKKTKKEEVAEKKEAKKKAHIYRLQKMNNGNFSFNAN